LLPEFFLASSQFSKDYSTNNQDVFIIIFDYRLLCLMFFLFSFDSPQHIAIVMKSTRTWERRVGLRRDAGSLGKEKEEIEVLE
jgi:undecaprenyl pyrophosphate synthase